MYDKFNISNEDLNEQFSTFNNIAYNIILSLLHLSIVLYFLTAILFRHSLWIRRHILFTHSVGLNIFLLKNYYQPETHGIKGGHNFYLKSSNPNSTEQIKLGVWHILPISLVEISDCKPFEYWNHTLRTSGKPIYIYFHGSMGSRATHHRIDLYKLLQEQDYHVITFDYRGFGDSTSSLPSETGSVADGLTVFNWLQETLGNTNTNVPIFFWGHSMGTGVSTHLTSKLMSNYEQISNPPTGLILEAPFTNMKEEIKVYFISYIYNFYMPLFEWIFVTPLEKTDILFESDRHILKIDIPIIILHAYNDPVVPYRLGKKLYNIASNSKPKRRTPIHLIKFNGFNVFTSHSYICHSSKLLYILKIFKDSCLKVTNNNNNRISK